MSTGIGFGFGIPHATSELIFEPVAALDRSKQRINSDALDGQPVNLVVLFLVPQGQFQTHLHTLANVTKLLHEVTIRHALDDARDAVAMLQVIKASEQSNQVPLRV